MSFHRAEEAFEPPAANTGEGLVWPLPAPIPEPPRNHLYRQPPPDFAEISLSPPRAIPRVLQPVLPARMEATGPQECPEQESLDRPPRDRQA